MPPTGDGRDGRRLGLAVNTSQEREIGSSFETSISVLPLRNLGKLTSFQLRLSGSGAYNRPITGLQAWKASAASRSWAHPPRIPTFVRVGRTGPSVFLAFPKVQLFWLICTAISRKPCAALDRLDTGTQGKGESRNCFVTRQGKLPEWEVGLFHFRVGRREYRPGVYWLSGESRGVVQAGLQGIREFYDNRENGDFGETSLLNHEARCSSCSRFDRDAR
jgi:hypothetical protein